MLIKVPGDEKLAIEYSDDAQMADEEPSYIDYETFLDPSFSAEAFANSLVIATNDPTDSPLDLSTPLSRVLFDVQEIDTHIHNLTSKSAIALLTYTKDRNEASQRISREIEVPLQKLTDTYNRLEKEVIRKWETADEARKVTERLWETVCLSRSVSRCLLLGRQLEMQMAELGNPISSSSMTAQAKLEDHRALVRSANTVVAIRRLFAASGPGEEAHGLERVNVITSLKNSVILPAEQRLTSRAQQFVRDFSLSTVSSSNAPGGAPTIPTLSPATYAQGEDVKSRTTSAILALYMLSTRPDGLALATHDPNILLSTLQTYLQTASATSVTALARALATLPTLDRALVEVSARCQNIVALEALLESIRPPHPSHIAAGDERELNAPSNMLQPLLQSLDTASLPSYFWRSLASSLSSRVQDIINRGGVSARTLRSNKEKVKHAIRNCVLRGSQPPSKTLSKGTAALGGNWEREAAVMVGSVLGVLGR
ncbi:hypothetical protein L228DRAFT_248513 [Xylona heveae TC161]|uniref:Conserved oligomeric Golgi complex subunit 5 n=1 Tax=Xylona heveae (strain CBS 132557 / TC161) TaxID=1328760 RepID=A0A165G5U8_XYLHT|nr:hypothetical protein L228DRAFT_248513 [Xylona heveae TC161]KZF21772.1 hypothetical protein L228DRAFT_248513 [Xylona heveae TC161]